MYSAFYSDPPRHEEHSTIEAAKASLGSSPLCLIVDCEPTLPVNELARHTVLVHKGGWYVPNNRTGWYTLWRDSE